MWKKWCAHVSNEHNKTKNIYPEYVLCLCVYLCVCRVFVYRLSWAQVANMARNDSRTGVLS